MEITIDIKEELTHTLSVWPSCKPCLLWHKKTWKPAIILPIVVDKDRINEHCTHAVYFPGENRVLHYDNVACCPAREIPKGSTITFQF